MNVSIKIYYESFQSVIEFRFELITMLYEKYQLIFNILNKFLFIAKLIIIHKYINI